MWRHNIPAEFAFKKWGAVGTTSVASQLYRTQNQKLHDQMQHFTKTARVSQSHSCIVWWFIPLQFELGSLLTAKTLSTPHHWPHQNTRVHSTDVQDPGHLAMLMKKWKTGNRHSIEKSDNLFKQVFNMRHLNIFLKFCSVLHNQSWCDWWKTWQICNHSSEGSIFTLLPTWLAKWMEVYLFSCSVLDNTAEHWTDYETSFDDSLIMAKETTGLPRLNSTISKY